MSRVRRKRSPRGPSAGTIAKPTIAIVGAGRVGCALGRRLHEQGLAHRPGDHALDAQRSRSAAPHRKRRAASRRLGSRSCRRCNSHLHTRPRYRRYRRGTGAAWRIQSFCRRAGGEAPKEAARANLARQGRFAYQRRAGQRCSPSPGASRRRNRVLASFADV